MSGSLIEDLIPKDASTKLVFYVNGKEVEEPNPDPEWTLLWYLRRKLMLTGTKYGCGEGGCGACTVMTSQYVKKADKIIHRAVNACIIPVCAMHGLAVTTVEGIGNAERLHPVQERLAQTHGSQCGFCTPGMVMSMYTLLRNNTQIKYDDINTALQGNLCRCTGYRPIMESFKTFMEGWERQYCTDNNITLCAMGKDCCKVQPEPRLVDHSIYKPYDPTQEPIFPPQLKLNDQYDQQYLYFKGEKVIWIRPKTLKELLDIKEIHPQCKIVGGSTEITIEMRQKKIKYPILVSIAAIPDLNGIKINNGNIEIGASKTLSDILKFLDKIIIKYPESSKIFQAIVDMLYRFAGQQVRNVATLTGNIITASPVSDLNPILMACSAKITVCSSKRGDRHIIIDKNFFKGYRKTAVEEDEVVISVVIPFTKQRQFFKAYKQARRKDDDITIVTAAFNVVFNDFNDTIAKANLCFGGMSATTISAKSSDKLIGTFWTDDKKPIYESLNQEFELDISVPGGMAEYRKVLCLGMFFKFESYVLQNLTSLSINQSQPLNLEYINEEISQVEQTSSQYFEVKDNNRKRNDAVGKPIPHASAFKQATGEAIYCDDIPQIEGELYLKLVFSSESHAKIISIDASKALLYPNVIAFFSAQDLDKKCNKIGPLFKDEEIFSEDLVTSRSCVIGAVVAKSESAARRAIDLVKVTYEKLQPVIVTVEDAIKYKSYFDGYPKIHFKKGNVVEAFAKHRVLEGSIRSGAQEHFYLETFSAFAVRKEDELEIFSTSQHPAEIASLLSHSLQIPNHKIVSKVKRIGGGFGGKETRAAMIALPVGIAAYKLKKAVRAVFERDEDMQVSGYRHPFLIKYRIAFTEYGKITGVIFDLYCNAGYSMDISCVMLDRAAAHIDNCYFIPNIEVNGYLCKTNMPSNTAFRGFGAPKVMLATECMIRDIATALGKTYEEIVLINMYQEGSLTHYNQTLRYCTLSRCWNECIEMSLYCKRKKQVEEYNKLHKYKKKGIALVPTKYGISFGADVLMQAGALLIIYIDGSVLISIGGIEMGQGLYTKMIQIASRALEINITKIHISEMSTDKVPNSSATAASISSDMYGMAVLNACNIMNDRLKPYKDKNPCGQWEEWIGAAYEDRVNLSVSGYYAAPKIGYDKEKNCGDLYEYFTYGVACSEVIIDCVTGAHDVLRTDIVMDVGESLNPAIDIGQIEGAFMQGYGFYTMEEMIFSPNGDVLSKGPGTYKIPGFSDVPKVFNVSLLKGAPNPRAVYSSKAVGEPPLFLASSVFFAIKDAISSARLESKKQLTFNLDAPATCERIRMACECDFTDMVTPTITKKGEPWNVVA